MFLWKQCSGALWWSMTFWWDLIWPRTAWYTQLFPLSFPPILSFSIFRLFIVAQNLPYPILCDHCPIMQWEMPPATTIYVCVENVTELWPHHKHIFLHPLRRDTVALRVCWSPTCFERVGQNKSFGAHLSATGFLLGFRNRAVPAYNRMMNLASYCPSQRPGTDGGVRKFWQLRPCWAKCKTED